MSKQEESVRTGTLAVAGVGEVKVKPDTAWVNLGVTTRAKTAQQAASANAELMTAVANRIKQLKVSDEDIQTGGLSVYPIIQHEEGPDNGKIIGYGAENYISVRTAVDKASQLFDEAIAAGANQSSSISFGLQDEAAARKKALELAMKSARNEAQSIAGAAGVQLGGPRNIEILRSDGRLFLDRARESSRTSTPIFPGLLTVSAQVNLVFDYLYR